MPHVRSMSLRALTSRPLRQRARLHLFLSRGPVRLFNARFVRRASLGTRLRAYGYGGQDTKRAEDTEYTPAFRDTLSYALVNAFPELNVEEEEMLKPLPRNIESLADDPSLSNPLERLERMGTGWFGVILDFEGVIVHSELDAHKSAWIRLAEEEGRAIPLQVFLQRAAPMKAEQAISEVFCWSREPSQVRRLALRKEELFAEITSDLTRTAREGLYRLMETLRQHNVPIAICSTERSLVYDCVGAMGLWPYVDVVVSAEDVYRCAPDPEAYAYAAQKLDRPPFRCVVIGASNHSCEAAHDCGMKCVATAHTQPLYELNAADLVIKQLDEISFINLKQLFRHEEFATPQAEEELHRLPPDSTMSMTW